MTTLHAHERAALERGSVLLLRPVEPQPPANIAIILPPPSRRVLDYWRETHDGQELPADWRMDAAFVVGDPLATDAGPVLVRAVRVVRLRDLSEADAEQTGCARDTEPCDHIRRSCEDIGCLGPTFVCGVAEWMERAYPAYPWQSAWWWAVTVERMG